MLMNEQHSIKTPQTKQKSLARSVCGQGFFSGDDGDRTRNLRLAKPALSQLSYVPPQVLFV